MLPQPTRRQAGGGNDAGIQHKLGERIVPEYTGGIGAEAGGEAGGWGTGGL